MKITVGKNYEGKSNDYSFEDGTYEFQIIRVEQTKGRVKMYLVTSKKRFAYKTFFMKDKKTGEVSDRAMRELADFITTAMQIDDDNVEVDIGDCVGYYFEGNLRNSEYKDEEGKVRNNYWINYPKRCDGFSDGTPSLLEWAASKNKNRKKEPEELVDEAMDETDTSSEEGANDVDSTLNDLLGI